MFRINRYVHETEHVVDMEPVKAVNRQYTAEKSRRRKGLAKFDMSNWRAPDPALLAAVSVMKSDHGWAQLEDRGPFLITSAEPPFLILWATKNWTQVQFE